MTYLTHDGSMMLLYMLTWIPSIYPSHVSIYTSTMDPSWGTVWWCNFTILKNDGVKVNGFRTTTRQPIYEMENNNMFETTNQLKWPDPTGRIHKPRGQEICHSMEEDLGIHQKIRSRHEEKKQQWTLRSSNMDK